MLAVVGQLGVLAVVPALGVLQVQDRRALDREGRPLCQRRRGRGLRAQFRPGGLDGPLGGHLGVEAGGGLGFPLALVPACWPALGRGRAGEGAEPGRWAEEGRGRRFACPLVAFGLLGFGEQDAGRHDSWVRAGQGLLPQHFGRFLLFSGKRLRERTHGPIQRVLKHLWLGQLRVLWRGRFRGVFAHVAGPEGGRGETRRSSTFDERLLHPEGVFFWGDQNVWSQREVGVAQLCDWTECHELFTLGAGDGPDG